MRQDVLKINVRTLTGKIFPLTVTSSNTVVELMEMIMCKEGIPLDQQRLIFNGKQMHEDRMISEYQVCDGSQVDLVLRLRGGKAPRRNIHV